MAGHVISLYQREKRADTVYSAEILLLPRRKPFTTPKKWFPGAGNKLLVAGRMREYHVDRFKKRYSI